MNKRITSLLLCFVMMLTMLATAVPVLAAGPTQLKVTSDKTEAHPGDTITFTITLGPVSDMGSMQMDLVIPTGLTYVANSGKLADGLQATLGFDAADWTEVTKRINGGASAADYSNTGDTVLATFKCTVNDGYTGTAKVGLDNLEFYSCQTWTDHTSNYSVVEASVTVTAAPVAVTGVTIDETLAVDVGASATPSWTVNPAAATNKTVSFISNKPAVATVNATTGEVTGVAEGTATITIKTADGNFTDTCTVTVTCAHADKTEHAAQASTCTVQGWSKYYSCDDCGQLFGADGTSAISAVPYLPLAAHTAVHHDAVAATHFASGNIEYWTCSVCGKYFSDAACTTEITQAATIEAQIPHSYGTDWEKDATNHWHECGCGSIIDQAEHTFEWKTDTAATEDATGLKHEECSVCGYKRSEGTVIPKLDHTHAMAKTDAKASNCLVQGNNEYYYCTKCNKYFKDEAGATETTVAAETLPLADHSYGTLIAEVPATHDAAGMKAHYKCSVCGKFFDADKNEVTEASLAIAIIPHSYGTEWTNDATNHWHECGCGSKIDVAEHTYGEWTVTKEATETEKGSKERVCSVCSYKDVVEIPVLGHTHVAGTEWKSDATNHWNECTANDGEKLNVAEHTYGDWTVTKEATATEKGSKERVCSVCGYKETAEIPATGVTPPTDNPDSPQTGDNSNMALWIALLFVSGAGVFGTTLYTKKKRCAE